jgi:hypothetical protein
MNTSIFSALLLSSLMMPTWHGNYSQAQREAANQKKPLVVVFGSGSNGWSKIIRDKAPSNEVSQLLLKEYVCVYIDTDMPDGKRLAQSFELPGNVGLVISDRALSSQAFWHQGDITNDLAVHYLQKYAQPDVAIRGTETTAAARLSYYPSQGFAPQGYAPQGYAPQMRTMSSGSC